MQVKTLSLDFSRALFLLGKGGAEVCSWKHSSDFISEAAHSRWIVNYGPFLHL
jgi:hypothetical protein